MRPNAAFTPASLLLDEPDVAALGAPLLEPLELPVMEGAAPTLTGVTAAFAVLFVQLTLDTLPERLAERVKSAHCEVKSYLVSKMA